MTKIELLKHKDAYLPQAERIANDVPVQQLLEAGAGSKAMRTSMCQNSWAVTGNAGKTIKGHAYKHVPK